MHPILFQIGSLVIFSFGFFLALAYLTGTYVFWKEGKRQGYQEEKLLDFSVAGLIAAIIGGRIFYTLINFQFFSESGNIKKIFFFWEGGFAYYGSFFLILLVGTYLIRRWRWNFLQIADIASLAVLVSSFFGKIGGFLAGNDYGSPTKLPWGITFPYLEGKRHPTQLYDAFLDLLLFAILYTYYKRNTSRVYKLKNGAVFFYFLFGSSLARLITEEFRGDSTYFGPFRLVTLLTLLLVAFALFSLYYFGFRNFRVDSKTLSHYLLGIGSRIKHPLKK